MYENMTEKIKDIAKAWERLSAAFKNMEAAAEAADDAVTEYRGEANLYRSSFLKDAEQNLRQVNELDALRTALSEDLRKNALSLSDADIDSKRTEIGRTDFRIDILRKVKITGDQAAYSRAEARHGEMIQAIDRMNEARQEVIAAAAELKQLCSFNEYLIPSRPAETYPKDLNLEKLHEVRFVGQTAEEIRADLDKKAAEEADLKRRLREQEEREAEADRQARVREEAVRILNARPLNKHGIPVDFVTVDGKTFRQHSFSGYGLPEWRDENGLLLLDYLNETVK